MTFVACPRCGRDNPTDNRFCGGCGTWIADRGANPPPPPPADTAFCGHCGNRIDGRSTGDPVPLDNPEGKPERRQITVVFCDLVGSTAISRRLDPEDEADLLQRYRETCDRVISEYGGSVLRYVGDGVLAYFGYPHAHDDDTRRAAGASLRLIEAIGEIDVSDLAEPPLTARVGLHTGVAFVGDLGRERVREQAAAVGEVPNLAARLHALAKPGQVIASEATAELIERHFQLRRLAPRSAKGFEEPVNPYRVIKARSVRPAVDRNAFTGPFVGRARELTTLWGAFDESRRETGRIAVLNGPPGVGKSRLVDALARRADLDPQACLYMRCEAQAKSSAFHPFRQAIARRIGRGRPDPSQAGINRILRALGLPVRERRHAHAIRALLDIEASADEEAEQPIREPSALRFAIFNFLTDWILGSAARKQTLCVIEDVQWADVSTLELLKLLAPLVAERKILIVLTQRPECSAFSRDWQPNVVRWLDVEPLSEAAARDLVAELSARTPLPDSLVQAVMARAGGNPLYLEEFVKSAQRVAQTHDPDSAFEIPATLMDGLMARLDALGAAKPVLQTAAVLGERFAIDDLAPILGIQETRARDRLNQAVADDLIRRESGHGAGTYMFKHALIRDFAYETILRRERATLHARAASVLARQPETCDHARVAYHYRQAGIRLAAADYWLKAGRTALRKSANKEALQSLNMALDDIQHAPTPEGEEARRLELDARLATAAPLIALRGWSTPELEENYRRALELASGLGDANRAMLAVRGMFNAQLLRANVAGAEKAANTLIRRSESSGDPRAWLQSLPARAAHAFFKGDFEQARRDFARVLEIYDPETDREFAYVFGAEPGVVAELYLAWIRWFDGDGAAAQAGCKAALRTATQADHPFSLGYALCFAASIHQCAGRPGRTLSYARRAVRLSEKYGFPYWQGWGLIVGGWAQSRLGHHALGLDTLKLGRRTYRGTGARLIEGYAQALQADVLDSVGDRPSARVTLAEGIAQMRETGVCFYLAPAEAALRNIEADLRPSLPATG